MKVMRRKAIPERILWNVGKHNKLDKKREKNDDRVNKRNSNKNVGAS